MTYTKDNILYIIDYDGKQLISNIKLYFSDEYNYTRVKSYSVKVVGTTLVISTPKTNDDTHYTDEYYYNTSDWSLIKSRLNVKETVS